MEFFKKHPTFTKVLKALGIAATGGGLMAGSVVLRGGAFSRRGVARKAALCTPETVATA